MSQSGSEDQYKRSGAEARLKLTEMLAQGRSYSGRERNCCFLNTGSDPRSQGQFANISAASGLDLIGDGRAVALVDWDQDGDLDMWVSNRNAPRLQLMRNDIGPGHADNRGGASVKSQNHFVAVRLVGNGQSTNRDAIGARVELVLAGNADAPRSVRTLRAGEGFLAQSSKWLQFGLGSVDEIDQLLVYWPGEQSQQPEVFDVPAVDRRYELVQGTGTVSEVAWSDRKLVLKPGQVDVLPVTTEARIPLQVLLPAPSLEYERFDGRSQVLSASGKFMLLNLWSTSCAPCLAELSDFTERASEIRGAGIDIVALSVDGLLELGNGASGKDVLSRMKFPFEAGMATDSLVKEFQDLHDQLMPLHDSLPLPTSMLIDPQGRLAAIYKGAVSIDQLLADVGDDADDSLLRFVRSAPLAGRLISAGPTTEAILRQEAAAYDLYAKRMEREGRMFEAVTYYQKVLDHKPDYERARHFIAYFLAGQGSLEAARAHLEETLQVMPEDADMHSLLSSVFAQQRNFDKALEHSREAARIKPEQPELQINLGNMFAQKGDLDQAAVHFREAVRLKPDLPEAHGSLGYVLLQNKDLEEAKKHFQEALKLRPSFLQVRSGLGTILLQQGEPAQAQPHFEAILAVQPNDPQAHLYLGRALAEQGNRDRALMHVRQAIRIQPNYAEARNYLAQLLNARGPGN